LRSLIRAPGTTENPGSGKGSGKILGRLEPHCITLARFRRTRVIECTIRLEARTGSGEVRTLEVGKLSRRVAGPEVEEVGLQLEEEKALLADPRRCIVQS